MHHPSRAAFRAHPLPPQGRGIRRSLFREYARTAIQQRSGILHGHCPRMLLHRHVPRLTQRQSAGYHRLIMHNSHNHRIFDIQHRDHKIERQDPDQRISAGQSVHPRPLPQPRTIRKQASCLRRIFRIPIRTYIRHVPHPI